MNIENSVALVTGSNRGIGREFVAGLLQRGAKRVYATARDLASLESVTALDPGRVIPLRMDITKRSEVEEVAGTARDVTLLVNNAGVALSGSPMDCPMDLVARNLETNYIGTLTVIRAFAPVIESNGGGAIVNVLSLLVLASPAHMGAYAASKAAASSMTQVIRASLGGKNISVHGVFPGPVDTDMMREINIPKSAARDVVTEVFEGLESGAEDIFPDPFSREAHAVWQRDPKSLERRFAGG
jgi:NAD(P)-dependent dehydrogenase (short-subunit alcohol dehydrogenase family)